MRNQIFICILLMLFVELNTAAGYDVAVLYDMSGSIQWSKQWQAAIQQANQEIVSLIGDGRIANETAWKISYSSLFESKIQGTLIEQGNYLLYLEFSEIERQEPPFFTRYKIQKFWESELSKFPKPLSDWLPSARTPNGKLTFLDLAKWQASNILDENIATAERIYIVFSDFERDTGDRNVPEAVLEKVKEYRTSFRETNLLKAYWKTQQGEPQKIGFEVFLVEPITAEPGGSKPIPTPEGIASLSLSPSTATVPLKATQQFTVSATDSAGNAAAITPSDVNWEVIGDIGTIDETGLFHAEKLGTGQIRASLKANPNITVTTDTIEVVKKTKSPWGSFLLIVVILAAIAGGAYYVSKLLGKRSSTP